MTVVAERRQIDKGDRRARAGAIGPSPNISPPSAMPPSGPPPRSKQFISPVDPAARWTASWGGPAVYAYCTNYLVDVQHAVIVDVEASTAVRQAEVTAAKRMIERAHDRLDLWPERLIADTG
jgi:hypothetical protein